MNNSFQKARTLRDVTQNSEIDGGNSGTCNADGPLMVSIIVIMIMNVEHYLDK